LGKPLTTDRQRLSTADRRERRAIDAALAR
jgi:hypothetical protein